MNQTLTALLLGGALLAGCQQKKNTPEQASQAAATDSAVAATDAAARVGKPVLLHTLPDQYNTPDGLALAPNGSLILSVPNLADNKYPAVLLEMTDDTIKPYLTNLPVQPDTKHAAPMDLAFGPDGNLYYAENQYENDKNFKSRLMRVRVQNGKPGAVETVVDNFALANAVVWKGNTIYVTDSQWDMPNDDKGSAILRFTLAELNKGPVHLKPKMMDPHVLTTFTTAVNETGVDNGADGLDYDSKGNFYTGSFGDGTFYKVTLKPDGSLAKKEAMALKGKKIPCIDGLIIDRTTDKAYVCNSRENAIEIINLADGTVTTLAQNGDTDGQNGLLDQPAEVLLKGNRLYISDFDKPEKKFVNQKSDAPHTMSYIDVQK
ncbi:SMP-30/gluconolactonase/LRE family protein [Hymenobacter sp. BT491]|uniref:SMP-30/gluconolactonase/LRE family protein n=1 Tax=Hymenobacter sp. BT491 TaxID=2766779 RepID=UPI001653958B|nr:SMP-30/gluconolactonase/LRE family protein [Hymenobacter sp. BT491]MBC6989829.1 SMP-30/gluconolactonase/LRE family protein [Hymenobacter sp. BT491]